MYVTVRTLQPSLSYDAHRTSEKGTQDTEKTQRQKLKQKTRTVKDFIHLRNESK